MPWYVLCSPDKYCVVMAQIPPGHRQLSPAFNTEREALKWRADHPANCRLFPPLPTPGQPQDFICS